MADDFPLGIPSDIEFCPRCRNPTPYTRRSDSPKQTTYARVCGDCGKRWGGIAIRKDATPDPWEQLGLSLDLETTP